LEIEDLKTYFYTWEGVVKAVDGVYMKIMRGECFGLVGESGCGKSQTALSIMRLIQSPPGEIISGKVYFEGKNLLDIPAEEMRKVRGDRISMIFQDPMSSLNPTLTIEDQLTEVIELHQGLDKSSARDNAVEMLKRVGIPDPERRIKEYPHQFSGGMQQRAMIAMALSCHPALLIADEPSTALDVTIQAQILELMRNLQQEFDTSVLLITHDLGVVAELAQHVGVMYLGKIVEFADVESIFKNPKHPYTQGLLASIPKLETNETRLRIIKGLVPDPFSMPSGCRFHDRCPHVMEICKDRFPPTLEVESGHTVACHLYSKNR